MSKLQSTLEMIRTASNIKDVDPDKLDLEYKLVQNTALMDIAISLAMITDSLVDLRNNKYVPKELYEALAAASAKLKTQVDEKAREVYNEDDN